jgi:uncharacterized protein YjbI with pentapeptide repeats
MGNTFAASEQPTRRNIHHRGLAMKFEIKNRFTGEVQFTAWIKAKKTDDESLKIGLAVKWAYETGANLDGANLYRANLDGANLYRANLDGANLYGANLYGANLYGANLVRANLDGANLDGANLVRANLDGANLVRANLDGANLDGANLDGANLDRANLDGANLDGANLDGANLIVGGQRTDGYRFLLIRAADASGFTLRAGCRSFASFADARAHWKDTRGGTELGDESLALVDQLERMATIKKWTVVAEQKAA